MAVITKAGSQLSFLGSADHPLDPVTDRGASMPSGASALNPACPASRALPGVMLGDLRDDPARVH